ncbi:MAG: type IX secretion system outer membrane channel protein PorV [Bacteroidales bacterium]
MNKTTFKKNTSAIALAIIIQFISYNIYSQISTQDLSGRVNTITSAVPFLMITPDSRAGGMGDLGVATSPDANSQYWNAAKYSFIKDDFGISMSYTPWLRELVDDIQLLYLSGYKKFKRGKAFGASLKYFSLGNITFTDIQGGTIRDFNPNEFSLDASYSMLFTDNFSGAVAMRYIYSNLTGGISSGSSTTHPGHAVAGDISLYYTKNINMGSTPGNMSYGLQISNIGNKITYSDDSEANFLPTNLRLGGTLKTEIDDYNSIMFGVDMNKLLVPTPPIYDSSYTIIAGKDPNVSVPTGMWQSFSDAPGGAKEEFNEITWSFGAEYWYDKRFALRTGYFYEHATKGNRKYFTVGVGLKLNVFQMDFAYLLPMQQNNPLANTLRFTLLFDFKGLQEEAKEANK